MPTVAAFYATIASANSRLRAVLGRESNHEQMAICSNVGKHRRARRVRDQSSGGSTSRSRGASSPRRCCILGADRGGRRGCGCPHTRPCWRRLVGPEQQWLRHRLHLQGPISSRYAARVQPGHSFCRTRALTPFTGSEFGVNPDGTNGNRAAIAVVTGVTDQLTIERGMDLL